MKYKILILSFIILASIGFAYAGTFVPQEGQFAYNEVQNYTLNDFNFIMPVVYNLTYQDDTNMHFEGNNETFDVSVVKDANRSMDTTTNDVSGSKTMLGSVEGNLFEKNGTYEFSFHQQDYMVTLTSKDMSLMIGVIGRD